MLASFTKYVILRDARGYIDWHSSLNSGFVGLNEDELFKVIEKKAHTAQRPEGVDDFWLVVAGSPGGPEMRDGRSCESGALAFSVGGKLNGNR